MLRRVKGPVRIGERWKRRTCHSRPDSNFLASFAGSDSRENGIISLSTPQPNVLPFPPCCCKPHRISRTPSASRSSKSRDSLPACARSNLLRAEYRAAWKHWPVSAPISSPGLPRTMALAAGPARCSACFPLKALRTVAPLPAIAPAPMPLCGPPALQFSLSFSYSYYIDIW